jgi:putative glutamine amidotransferase
MSSPEKSSTATPQRPPVIGVGGIPMQCQFAGVWDRPVVMLHRSYVDAIERAGAIAVIFAPGDTLSRHPATALDLVDGLILAGGADIGPARYGQDPHPKVGTVDVVRDESELALANVALARDLPVLGICRGMELLNVAAGGTLIQHLPDRVGHDGHLQTPGTFEIHQVDVTDGTATAWLVGGNRCTVMSHHHQAVDKLGSNVTATAWDPDHEVVEAIELDDRRFAVGVQWHPEEDPNSTVIQRFVAAVAAQKHDRSNR